MAEIFGNLDVRGSLRVDGTGGGLSRVEFYDNKVTGDQTFIGGGALPITDFTELEYGTNGNEANGQNYYLVRGTFPFQQNGADGFSTFTFSSDATTLYKIKVHKDSDRPEAVASFHFLVQPDAGATLSVIAGTSAGSMILYGGDTDGLFSTISIERIT